MNVQTLHLTMLLVAGFLFQGQVFSQDMYVKANTFVYASNQSVYIKNALELNTTTSNFYLRNGGQLLQGTTGSGANKGVGRLSVFQEGTVNNFQFNYWCSPVGNTGTSTAVNNPFGIMLLGRPTTVTATTPVALSVSTYDGTASPLTIAPYWIYKFQVNLSSYSDWVQVGSASTINAGEGFTMKGSSGTDNTVVSGVQNNPDGKNQRYDFKGKPNDGTINIPVLLGEWTLTGNPYPSAVDLQAFLIEELNCTGSAYFWEQDKYVNSHNIGDYKGGYGTYAGGADEYARAPFFSYDGAGNQISGTQFGSGGNYERKYSPIGQGFMIEGLANGNVQMKNSYRKFVKEGIGNSSQFEKIRNNKIVSIVNTKPKIRFNTLLDNGPISQMILLFDPLSTDGVDRAMDAASPNDGPANNYFVINNNEYIIQVMPFDIDKKIAIGFRNYAEANYKITVNEMLNIPEVSDVFLHDKTTNLYHDIKNNFYDLTLPAGTYNTQYEITFKKGTLELDETKHQNFTIRQDNINKNLIVSNPLQLDLVSCNLYDVVGRLIFTKTNLGTNSSYTFETSDLTNGIYIVKLSTNEKTEMSQKIIVKN